MTEFPFSLRQAAKRLGVGRNKLRAIVREHNISTSSSPLNGRAKMLDRAAYESVARKVEVTAAAG